MTGRRIPLAWLSSALLLAGCARAQPLMLPAVSSPPPSTVSRGLLAGLARTDITPPPGPGLAGGGPEGRPAAGHRARLHARALVLEDRRGEIVAYVVADLPFVSVILHRRVAELVRARAPIGADRLMLAATHTHSGPGHFLDAESYNRQGSSVPGYDPAMVAFLAERVAGAVLRAWESRGAARVAWGTTTVASVTRNRSAAAGGAAPDSTLLLLRVDVRSGPDADFRPAGALSILAIHGTGNSPENDLWDGDIHGRVARILEAHVDSLAGGPGGPAPRAVYLFANGAEGDVSPTWSAASRCTPPALRRTRMRGPHGTRGWEWVGVDAATRETCLAAARDGMETTSRAIAVRAAALFDALAPGPDSDTLFISRAFTTLPLTGPGAPPGLCAEAEPGAATIAGAEDMPTRYRGWRFLGFIPSAFEEGGRAARHEPRGCQAEKRPALDGKLRRISGISRIFPQVAQLAVVRIGGLLTA
ncbi:MAG: neutral/alkaline non-lysosomal ceramidase N-terminal domain-containing protein, partial [Gemmatimonadales bacterium]